MLVYYIMEDTLLATWKETKKELEARQGQHWKLLYDFLLDMELGLNVPKGSSGSRRPATLLRLARCLTTVFNLMNGRVLEITQREIHELFKKMKDGDIRKANGTPYKDVSEFIKNAKVFYGWLKRTKQIPEDITSDLSMSAHKGGKPNWVYLGNDKMKLLIDKARGDYRALILFLYDSGLRPQEAWKIKVEDFSEDYAILTVLEKRGSSGERVSKTFARTIKLMQSSQLIKDYIKSKNLKPEDYLIDIEQHTFNSYLKTLSLRYFGNPKVGDRGKITYEDTTTKARGKLSNLKLYDIRHNSVCYWLDKYKTNKDLMYRFGWIREDKIFYYSEFLGKRDTIGEDDMFTKEDKTKLEIEIERMKKENEAIKKYLLTFIQEVEKQKQMPNSQETPVLLYKKIEEQAEENSFS